MPLDFLLEVMRAPDTPTALRFRVASITTPYLHKKNQPKTQLEKMEANPTGMISWSIAQPQRRNATTAEDWCACFGHGPRITIGRNARQRQ
jgi:hypothetical protein